MSASTTLRLLAALWTTGRPFWRGSGRALETAQGAGPTELRITSGGSRRSAGRTMCVQVRVTDLSSHLQNGCHRPSDEGRGVKHASVMVTEGIGTTCNHSWLTLGVVDFPLGPPRGRSGPSRRPSGLSSQLKIRRQDELQLYRSVPSCLE